MAQKPKKGLGARIQELDEKKKSQRLFESRCIPILVQNVLKETLILISNIPYEKQSIQTTKDRWTEEPDYRVNVFTTCNFSTKNLKLKFCNT